MKSIIVMLAKFLSYRWFSADLDDSLAPPPLDPALSVPVRLATVRSMLSASSAGSGATKVMFDAREQYKIYTLGCEGNIVGPYQVMGRTISFVISFESTIIA